MDKPVEPVDLRRPGHRACATSRERDFPVDNDADLAAAWQHVIEELQPNQQAWVKASEPAGWHGNTAIIAVGDDFTRTQLEGRLRGQLEDA